MTQFLSPSQRRLASLPSQERETIELIVETFGAVLVEGSPDLQPAGRESGVGRTLPIPSTSTANQPPEGEQQMGLVMAA